MSSLFEHERDDLSICLTARMVDVYRCECDSIRGLPMAWGGADV
jgi:hypothetical protein